MKKIYLISLITIILGFIFTLKPDWFTFFWGWQIMLLPMTGGILMVLVQNEYKSYRFLPKLIIGSIITSFVFVIIWQIIVYMSGEKLFIPEALYTALFFAAIIIFGGLLGIVIRGANFLIKNYTKDKKFKLLSLGVLAILVLAIIFFVISNLLQKSDIENNHEEITLAEIQKQYDEIHKNSFKVIGEFVCLPLKDENIPHNDLCVFGIKNSNSDYYRLQAPSDDKNNIVNKIRKGQKIEISGELIDEESEIYKTLGTIKVEGVKYLYTEEGNIESNLPDSFKANYISFQNYGSNVFKAEEYPKLESWVENGEIECDETPLESSLPLRISKKEINGQKYCIGASSEGAAGSVYTQYAYTTVIGDNVYLVQFVVRYPSCSNYPDKERKECETERENFNLDNLVDLEVRRME